MAGDAGMSSSGVEMELKLHMRGGSAWIQRIICSVEVTRSQIAISWAYDFSKG